MQPYPDSVGASVTKSLLEKYNKRRVRSIKGGIPYNLRAKKGFRTKEEALKEELRLKRAKNKEYLEWLINGN